MVSPELIKLELQKFHGSEILYPCSNRNFVMSEGVNYLTEAAECNWLVDAIPCYIGRFGKRLALVELKKTNSQWTLTLADTEGKPRVIEPVVLCTFPLAEITLFVQWDEGFNKWVVFLPSER